MIAAIALAAVLQVRPTAPRIDTAGTEPVLVLPDAMAAALRKFSPRFSVRRLRDYPSILFKKNCAGPACPDASYTYTITSRAAPFAVIGDFNGDRVLDVVVDGDDGLSGHRVVIMSGPTGFVAREFQKLSLKSMSPEEDRRVARSDEVEFVGESEFLTLVRPGTVRSPWESRPLRLLTDAFQGVYFESAAVIYYYRDARWRRYQMSD